MFQCWLSFQSYDENTHQIKIAVGNGLRSDIWEHFQKRFNIPNIVEFYGATEGTGGFFNIHNKTGAVGRCSPLLVSGVESSIHYASHT